MINGLLLTS